MRWGIEPNKLAELHGNVAKLQCRRCERRIDRSFGLTVCQCGGRFVDSVVNFGQSLPQWELRQAFEQAKSSDLFVVLGRFCEPINEILPAVVKRVKGLMGLYD